ncbi:cerebellin-1-like [Ostrea edulis]|uniref:cerebellin-1-like n=1 Tax=Ostrea edulis TaxID=37623 RepID=UPI0024AF5F81|nr:cerebellin-1-like [Ostrea edulis]
MFGTAFCVSIFLASVTIARGDCSCKKNIHYYNICMKSAENNRNGCGLHLSEYETCIKKEFTSLKSKVQLLERAISGISTERKVDTISFMASPATNIKPVSGATLIFGNVLTNKGGAYNGRTGVFTAPVSGSYFFMCTIGLPAPSSANDYLRIHIMKNGKISSYLFIGAEGMWIKRSENTLLQLQKGDKVYLKIRTNGGGQFPYIAGSSTYPGAVYHSHFSGFLI